MITAKLGDTVTIEHTFRRPTGDAPTITGTPQYTIRQAGVEIVAATTLTADSGTRFYTTWDTTGESVGEYVVYATGTFDGLSGEEEIETVDIIAQYATIDTMVDDIWDELLTGTSHNIKNSAGKILRTLQGMVIHNGNAQGAGTGNNQIQLDTDAASTDGAYDPALVVIVDGAGVGQTRLILQYDGATRTATVDRGWKDPPDVTSEFNIVADAGREHVNEGLAQAGASMSITLNTLASSDDDAYVGQTVFIRSGTGEDQARVILAYNGTTKVAIVDRDWDVTPDSTSAYIMWPVSLLSGQTVRDAMKLAPAAGAPAADSIDEHLDDIKAKTDNLPSAFPRNVEQTVSFKMVSSSDLKTGQTGLTVTLELILDQAAPAASTNPVTEIGLGWYKVTLTAAEKGAEEIILEPTASGAIGGLTIYTDL